MRLILDGTVVRVRLDRKATNISLLVGARRAPNDGQKVLLSVKNMGGESEAAWRGVLDDLIARGLRTAGVPDHRRREPDWSGRWRRCGPTCRRSAALCINIGTCWPMRRTRCTKRSRPTTRT